MVDIPKSLLDMLGVDVTVNVVDIGANPLEASGMPPYKSLLDRGHARLVGFEPNALALEDLNAAKGPHETYLPHAVFDGGRHTLHICQAPGMTSLLEPDPEWLQCFHGFEDWGKVMATEELDTVRLDDVEEIADLDFLKIDIQGAELEVFRHGTAKLADCLVIQCEVEFLPVYKNQPLFSDIDLFLREQGFRLHRLSEQTSRVIKPLIVDNDPYAGLSQLLWADAVFVRDFSRLDRLSPEKLLRLALLLHDVYSSYDLALRVLLIRDAMLKTQLGQTYLQRLQSS